MQSFIKGLAALLVLFAFNACNGDPSGNGGNTNDTSDPGVQPEDGLIQAKATAEGAEVVTTINVDDLSIGTTDSGTCLDSLTADDATHKVTVGDYVDQSGHRTITADGKLPIVTAKDGSQWIAPEQDVVIPAAAQCLQPPLEFSLNFYAGETKNWTCEAPDLWSGKSSPFKLEYTDGHILDLGFASGIELSGKSLYLAGSDTPNAEFESDSLISGEIDGHTFTCSSK